MQKVLVTGGKGLIGKQLCELLEQNSFIPMILSRSPKDESKYKEYKWSPKDKEIDDEAILNADFIIHLAGAGIADKPWTDSRKKELYSSRVNTAKLLFEKCDALNHFPKAFISSSGINAYGGDTGDKLVDETTQMGDDFVANLVKEWEAAADLFSTKGVRVVKLRTGMVLSKKGGAYPKLSLPVKFGIGAPLGSGKQYISWIHIKDVCKMYKFAIKNEISGAFNAVSSQPVTNKEFMKSLSKALSRPFFVPNVPAFALKLTLGEMSEILLGGNKASNEKIIEAGFEFSYPDLNSALEKLVR